MSRKHLLKHQFSLQLMEEQLNKPHLKSIEAWFSQMEDTFNEEAILISDGENDVSKGTITDGDEESAKDELSKRSSVSSKYQLMLATAEQLMKEWNSPIYAFFDPTPIIETVNGHCAHAFKCMGKGCKVWIRCFLDKKDACLMGNMQKHVRTCWGDEVLQTAYEAKNAEEVQTKIVASILHNGSITASFECKGKGKVTYSHRQHTHTEMKWVLKFHVFSS
ncbi:uncharacterized protein BJ212DRAFT_1298359 [Suillus subaureus]|uniref:Uncharacterized protein n=1 Tax=Suillus subaureus TaxID=48587 RepID=A0A9P7EET3_9AGAM|nr:uncharacterized protein BJ212DRAFT_1298359 [Suillus subaureus]KAG1819090.1 hypothetical protein BJ212DRAFT_1298359 [Suillus subaureus]